MFGVLVALASFQLVAQQVDSPQSRQFEGASRVPFLNYSNCIELTNESTRVVLCHQVGGRILVYENNGKNVLYLAPEESQFDPVKGGNQELPVSGGRFDVGPEYLMPRTDAIWKGVWQSEIIGDRRAILTSQIDPQTKIQVQREFELDAKSSKLRVRQTIKNTGREVQRVCYWSRTFAVHGGVVVIPCRPNHSMLPNLYFMSKTRYKIDFKPEDSAVQRVEDMLVIHPEPAKPKLGFDAAAGWVAYQSPTDQLFVKRFPVYPERKYGDPGGLNFSVFYPKSERLNACEIEPIGPLEYLKQGESALYEVNWWLMDRAMPENKVVDANKVAKFVQDKCSN